MAYCIICQQQLKLQLSCHPHHPIDGSGGASHHCLQYIAMAQHLNLWQANTPNHWVCWLQLNNDS